MSELVVLAGAPVHEDTPSADAPSRPPVSYAPFLARLDERERQVIRTLSCLDRYPAGSLICREGDPARALYIVQVGQVAVLKEVEHGRSILLGYRGPGELLGEMSLVGEQPRSASLIAMTDSELQRVDAIHFPQLVEHYPGISRAILSVLNERLQEADVARTAIVREEESLTRRLEEITGEAQRLAELARVRKDTVELLVHDLRTPLGVIHGCLEMLRNSLPKDCLTSEGPVLDLAERSAARLMTLVEDLLRSARQEVTIESLTRRPLDVGRLLETAVQEASKQAQGLDLEIAAHVSAGLPRLSADNAQLHRVLDNLLSNAISYTNGGGTIDVNVACRNDQIEVSVTDTGPGVPLEHREIIFERFTRVPGMQGRRQGFGLGLYFCRQVIQAHGGRIWVEPGPRNCGSRFVFTLPLNTGPPPAPGQEAE